MNAIVLAGGFGSRLKPLTDDCPKPMLPLANRPMLDYVVSQLNHFGIREIIFTLGYKAEKVRAHASGYKGIDVKFICEDTPLGTAGAVKNAEEMLDDVFFVMSGDALSNVNLNEMLLQHLRTQADVTIATVKRDDVNKYGVIQTNNNQKVMQLIEKPSTNKYGNKVNAGIYLINKKVLMQIPKGVKFDFSCDLFPKLIESGTVFSYSHDGYWCDIGDKNSYYDANYYVLEGGFYNFVPHNIDRNINTIKQGNLVSNSAITVGRFRNSIVGQGVMISSNAVINECIVMPNVVVGGKHERCIIGDNYVERLEKTAVLPPNITQKANKILANGV